MLFTRRLKSRLANLQVSTDVENTDKKIIQKIIYQYGSKT